MPKFSNYFKIGLNQRQLDFVDVNTDYDTPVYVDPYAIEIRNDLWAENASGHIRSLFLEVLTVLRAGDDRRADNLMSHFQEPRETYLGVSRGKPKGRGVGRVQSSQLIKAIKGSAAFSTGLLSDLSEMSLFVDKMDRDKISDLTTNIIRFLLTSYTNEQCELHGIPTEEYNGPSGWNKDRKNWESRAVKLPHINGEPVLLVPKYIVRRRLSLDSQEFYNKQITDVLVAEHLTANSSLVHTIKGGKEKKVYRTEVREKHPKSKTMIADLVRKYPDILQTFKDIARNQSMMSTISDDDPSLQNVCEALIKEITSISPGRAGAENYHRAMLGAITVLFYPSLIQPHKEWEIHEGRKRIDIVYTNAADSGFFSHRRDANNTQANLIIVECKNYSDDIGNVEIDQLYARFDNNRGKFGILTCRSVDNEAALVNRCRDISSRGLGYIIVLTDADICAMLIAKMNLEDGRIEEILNEKFRQLLQ